MFLLDALAVAGGWGVVTFPEKSCIPLAYDIFTFLDYTGVLCQLIRNDSREYALECDTLH